MGCDIHGYVEVETAHSEDREWWRAAGNIEPLVGRAYDSFGCLFGVRNYSQFDPVAADRGIPENASRTVSDEHKSWGIDAHSASYVTFDELQDIDWNENATAPDARYSILDENKEPTGTKFGLGPGSGWTDIVEKNSEKIKAGEPVAGPDGDRYIQRRVLTREEALSGAWEWLIDDYLPLLADRFGEDSVRVVVWFDN